MVDAWPHLLVEEEGSTRKEGASQPLSSMLCGKKMFYFTYQLLFLEKNYITWGTQKLLMFLGDDFRSELCGWNVFFFFFFFPAVSIALKILPFLTYFKKLEAIQYYSVAIRNSSFFIALILIHLSIVTKGASCWVILLEFFTFYNTDWVF